MGRLTTHVLDTAAGKPAAGVEIEVWWLAADDREPELVRVDWTNADGRTDGPLLESPGFYEGSYEMVFVVGDYFAGQPVAVSDPPFLDRVPVRFTIANTDLHYHIPLLVSPWAYSTYRGS